MLSEEKIHKGAGFIATGLWRAADLIYKGSRLVDRVGEVVNAGGHLVLDTAIKFTEENNPEPHPHEMSMN